MRFYNLHKLDEPVSSETLIETVAITDDKDTIGINCIVSNGKAVDLEEIEGEEKVIGDDGQVRFLIKGDKDHHKEFVKVSKQFWNVIEVSN